MNGSTGTRPAPERCWIDTPAGPVFAVHHRARAAVAQGRGVVLCNPFGIEALTAHRAYRHLAERLADAGISAVRFDYHGTGDSSGRDEDPDRLGAWVESTRACMRWLRARDGVSEVALFGVRFGGLIAMQAANLGGVDTLV